MGKAGPTQRLAGAGGTFPDRARPMTWGVALPNAVECGRQCPEASAQACVLVEHCEWCPWHVHLVRHVRCRRQGRQSRSVLGPGPFGGTTMEATPDLSLVLLSPCFSATPNGLRKK